MAQLTDKGYLHQLKWQRDFLSSDLAQYELGKAHFAFRIAGTLRTVFYRGKNSTPILPDLAERYGLRLSFKGHRKQETDYKPMMHLRFQSGNLKPNFDAPFLVTMDFQEYWNETICVLDGDQYTRQETVCAAANKLGGAHVDPKIPAKLLRIVEGNVMLGSLSHGEEAIITRALYETGYQVLQVLGRLIPELEKRILPERDRTE
jgi:hypothetical protein